MRGVYLVGASSIVKATIGWEPGLRFGTCQRMSGYLLAR